MNFKEIKFQNPGVLITDIPSDTWEKLSQSIKAQVENKEILKNLKLLQMGVGGIYESIKFVCPNEFLNFSNEFIEEYHAYFGLSKPKDIKLMNAWINLQKKYEYRPSHIHKGNLSFVLWYKIPYNLAEEDSFTNNYKIEKAANGRFEFIVQSLSGKITSEFLNLDSTFEGKMILFDSDIRHAVMPFFTSEDIRISVAGNFMVKR